jgi:hypothetical protein
MRLRAMHVVAIIWFLIVVGTAALAQQPGAGSIALAQLPDDRIGIRTAPILLLTRPDVSADIGLSAEQTDAAAKAIQEFQKQAFACKSKSDGVVVLARKQIDENQSRWLKEHLSEPQLVRLLQIDLQWEGPSALVSRPIVSQTLGLSAGQVEILKLAVKKAKARRAVNGYSPVDELDFKKVTLAVLSIDQQNRWNAILGPRFVPRIAGADRTQAAK